MTSNAKEILDRLVSQQKVKVGGGYPIPALDANARGWIATDPTDALNELVEAGYLKVSGGRFALTQSGYDFICKDKTIEVTKQRIVMHIHESSQAEPKRLNRGALGSFRDALSGCRSDNFDDALEGLAKEGIIESDSFGTVTLTGKRLKK